MEDLRKKFEEEIELADWSMLSDHHKSQALFFISEKLDLVNVAIAIAQDKLDFVKLWLDDGELYRPTDEMVEKFEANRLEQLGQFLIVQPYVILKPANVMDKLS